LPDNEDVNADAPQRNIAEILNDAGQVVGRTVWVGDQVSQAVWLYDKGKTRAIGLTDLEHTHMDGRSYSNLPNNRTALNSAGQVLGYSHRFRGIPNADFGRTAWLYSDGEHTRLGLEGAEYTGAYGYRHSEPVTLNNAGQVAGYSKLYLEDVEYPACSPGIFDGTYRPRTGWFYDHPTGEMIPLTLSSRADGYEYSDVFHLSDSGVATGHYIAFNAEDDSCEWRMFQFSLEEGPRDIVIDGMESLSPDPPFLTHQSGHFVGWFGEHVNGEGLGPFLLSPLP
jgi:hypothetical protein